MFCACFSCICRTLIATFTAHEVPPQTQKVFACVSPCVCACTCDITLASGEHGQVWVNIAWVCHKTSDVIECCWLDGYHDETCWCNVNEYVCLSVFVRGDECSTQLSILIALLMASDSFIMLKAIKSCFWPELASNSTSNAFCLVMNVLSVDSLCMQWSRQQLVLLSGPNSINVASYAALDSNPHNSHSGNPSSFPGNSNPPVLSRAFMALRGLDMWAPLIPSTSHKPMPSSGGGRSSIAWALHACCAPRACNNLNLNRFVMGVCVECLTTWSAMAKFSMLSGEPD